MFGFDKMFDFNRDGKLIAGNVLHSFSSWTK